ncbi:hypothetical protein GCM10028807_58210 [Spirosoma daeguense]
MKIECENVSVELDEVVEADNYFVSFVAQITNTVGRTYDITYAKSHENDPDFRESIRDIIERGVRQYTGNVAYCAKKNGIVLKELDIKIIP